MLCGQSILQAIVGLAGCWSLGRLFVIGTLAFRYCFIYVYEAFVRFEYDGGNVFEEGKRVDREG